MLLVLEPTVHQPLLDVRPDESKKEKSESAAAKAIALPVWAFGLIIEVSRVLDRAAQGRRGGLPDFRHPRLVRNRLTPIMRSRYLSGFIPFDKRNRFAPVVGPVVAL
jgi:hypothetical protein